MAAQWVVCVVMILLTFKGCHSQQPACGRSVNSTITGGQYGSPGSWPWHAAIEYSGNVLCQGSLISDQWVLTAASCSVNSYLGVSKVRLGVQDLSALNPNEEIRDINAIVCHQAHSNFENNICLLQLSSPVNFTDYIQPVCLASENSTFYEGTTSWVTGFGRTVLQEVNTQIVGNKKCHCDVIDFITITENEICAGSLFGSNHAFYNDDGAALVTKKDSSWVQSGILSGGSGYPSVYTRVSRYQKWISDRVTGMQPGFVTFTSTGNDSDLNYVCPMYPYAVYGSNPPINYPPTMPTTSPPTTPYPAPTFDSPFFPTTPTTTPVITRDCGIFCSSGENLIPITHFMSLSALVLFLHAFVESIF